MTSQTKILLSVISLLCFIIASAAVYLTLQKILSMPFRSTNDALHKQGAPITLDSFIPAGTHIDEKMTIGQVVRMRFERPRGRFNHFIQMVSESIPLKYRFWGAMILYLFWTLLFLIFFRIFTWIRYIVALSISFFAGSVVYFFMPDFILGRVDDVVFLAWAISFAAAGWWFSRGRKPRYS